MQIALFHSKRPNRPLVIFAMALGITTAAICPIQGASYRLRGETRQERGETTTKRVPTRITASQKKRALASRVHLQAQAEVFHQRRFLTTAN